MQVENLYTSVACNRTTECADWGPNGLIAFGACNAVAILDPKFEGNSAKIIHTYVQHTKRVNTVKWLDANLLLSGADDNNAVLWQLKNTTTPHHLLLKGHSSGVNALDGVLLKNQVWLLATAAADNNIKLWHYKNQEVNCFQTVDLNRGFCFSLRLTLLPKSDYVLLAFSGDDETVSLWAQQEISDGVGDAATPKFTQTHKLSGHEDWVRSLDFVADGEDLLLASGSQDNFIRLWRIAPRSEAQMVDNSVNLLSLSEADGGEIRVEEKIVQLGEGIFYAISLESVLYGHEAWIYGVHWHKTQEQELRLLSASIDKTLIVWAPTEDDIWLEQTRLGFVGGNSMGFFGGKFSHDGNGIMGHNYQGGFHIWHQDEQQINVWKSNVIASGHYGEVRDLAWEHEGAYLVTVSSDQTTRLHAPWVQPNKTATWHELARPQIHGYDMQALALLSRYKFASGAEEKIVRTFQAPANFIENFRNLSQLDNDAAGETLLDSLPKGASVPSLGLSNKAVFKAEDSEISVKKRYEYPESYFEPVAMKIPPQEEMLMQNTLWPEVQKLYGHGYELYALAATQDGRLLASTCRASNAEHAQIILWNTEIWKQFQKLSGHQLTVTQLRFSPDARYLLSVSRDRSWCLFERQNSTDSYALTAKTDKTNGQHARIIWSCDWSHDGKYFATSSRDGMVVVWTHVGAKEQNKQSSLNGWTNVSTLTLKNQSITALAFASHNLAENVYVLAVGLESGHIKIYKFFNTTSLELLCDLNNNQAHHLTVKRLQFRPGTSDASERKLQLASCGDDHLVRMYNINL